MNVCLVLFRNIELIFLDQKTWKALHWLPGKKTFGKIASKHVKTRLDTFGIDFGIFGISIFFWFFRKLSMNPWNNEQKNFQKKRPKTRLDTRERI